MAPPCVMRTRSSAISSDRPSEVTGQGIQAKADRSSARHEGPYELNGDDGIELFESVDELGEVLIARLAHLGAPATTVISRAARRSFGSFYS